MAEAVSGSIVANGELAIPAGARIVAFPEAVYLGDTSLLSVVRLSAANLRVDHRSMPEPDVPASVKVPGTAQKQSYNLTDVRGLLRPDDEGGWLGIYFEPGQMAEIHATSVSQITGNATQTLGTGESFWPDDPLDPDKKLRNPLVPDDDANDPTHPESSSYMQKIAGPHLVAASPGRIVVRGSWMMKIQGPDLALESGGSETLLHTGKETRTSSLGTQERVQSWAVLKAHAGELVLETTGAIELAARTCKIEWDGATLLSVKSAELRSEHRSYLGAARSIDLAGAFSAIVQPNQTKPDELLELSITGDLRETTLASALVKPGASPPGAWASSGALVVGGLLVALAIGATVAVRMTRSQRLPLDELLDLADRAAEAGQFERAREWTAKALERMPEHPRVLIDHGFFCAQCGAFEEALAAYRRAAEVSSTGEAEFMASRLVAEHLGDLDEAEALLVRALEQGPELVFEAEEAPALDPLVLRPRVAEALARARRRVGG